MFSFVKIILCAFLISKSLEENWTNFRENSSSYNLSQSNFDPNRTFSNNDNATLSRPPVEPICENLDQDGEKVAESDELIHWHSHLNQCIAECPIGKNNYYVCESKNLTISGGKFLYCFICKIQAKNAFPLWLRITIWSIFSVLWLIAIFVVAKTCLFGPDDYLEGLPQQILKKICEKIRKKKKVTKNVIE